MILRDFAIEPSVSGGGTHGIHFEQTHANGYMANWQISGISMDLSKPWGSISVNLDNHIASADGFFTGIIEKCIMTSGPDGGIVGDHNHQAAKLDLRRGRIVHQRHIYKRHQLRNQHRPASQRARLTSLLDRRRGGLYGPS